MIPKLLPEEVTIEDAHLMLEFEGLPDRPDFVDLWIMQHIHGCRVVLEETSCGLNLCWAAPLGAQDGIAVYSLACCLHETPIETIWKRGESND